MESPFRFNSAEQKAAKTASFTVGGALPNEVFLNSLNRDSIDQTVKDLSFERSRGTAMPARIKREFLMPPVPGGSAKGQGERRRLIDELHRLVKARLAATFADAPAISWSSSSPAAIDRRKQTR